MTPKTNTFTRFSFAHDAGCMAFHFVQCITQRKVHNCYQFFSFLVCAHVSCCVVCFSKQYNWIGMSVVSKWRLATPMTTERQHTSDERKTNWKHVAMQQKIKFDFLPVLIWIINHAYLFACHGDCSHCKRIGLDNTVFSLNHFRPFGSIFSSIRIGYCTCWSYYWSY